MGEFNALTHLAAHGITAAPQPLWHDPDAVLPAVAMTIVSGAPLPNLTDHDHPLRAAIDVLGRLRHLPLGPFSDLPRVDSATNYLHSITEIWPDQLREHPDEPLTADLMTLLDTWLDRGDAELVEHLSAHHIDDTAWISLLPKLGVNDDHTRRRFLATQRTVALRWLTGLVDAPAPACRRIRVSVRRVLQLHHTDFL